MASMLCLSGRGKGAIFMCWLSIILMLSPVSGS
jgi:hypothetical protein